MPALAILPVLTGAVAAASFVGMALIGSAVIGTIGMITGNETMMKIGGILGIVGGVGAMAGVGTTPLFGAKTVGMTSGAAHAATAAQGAAAVNAQNLAAANAAAAGSVTGVPTGTVPAAPPPATTTMGRIREFTDALGKDNVGIIAKGIQSAFTVDPQIAQVEEQRRQFEATAAAERARLAGQENITVGIEPSGVVNPYATIPYRTPAYGRTL